VARFNAFLNESAAGEHIEPDLLGAKLVGRYKSGCPLERTKDESPDLDPQIADPSLGDPTLLSDAKINNFEYGSDSDGAIVPRAAHIRKSYPRDEATPGGGEADTQTHRFPDEGDGEDPIIAQASEPRTLHAPNLSQPLSIPQFVTTTGGEYFFAPSISALNTLAGQ
jgi:deferrochelatase/peroxidase EfeB